MKCLGVIAGIMLLSQGMARAVRQGAEFSTISDVLDALTAMSNAVQEDVRSVTSDWQEKVDWCEHSVWSMLDPAIAENQAELEEMSAKVVEAEADINKLDREIESLEEKQQEAIDDWNDFKDDHEKDKGTREGHIADYNVTISALEDSISKMNVTRVEVEDNTTREFASGHILQLLKDMRVKFEDEKTTAEYDLNELENQYAYLKARHDNEQDAIASAIAEKKDLRGTKVDEKQKASASIDLLQEVLGADKTERKTTIEACEGKAVEYQKKQKLLADEIKAIKSAVALLESIASHPGVPSSAKAASLAFMRGSVSPGVHRGQGTRGHLEHKAILLSYLKREEVNNATINLTESRTEIQNLIATIQQLMLDLTESDTDHDAWCASEESDIERRRSELTTEEGEINSLIVSKNLTITTLENEIDEHEDAVKEEEASGLEEDAEHEKNSAGFEKDIAEAMEVQTVVRKAIDTLQDFATQARASLNLAQVQAPEPVQLDSMPEGDGDESAARVDGIDNVVAFLKEVLGDAAAEEASARADLKAEESEHQKIVSTREISRQAKQEQIKYKSSWLVDAKRDLSDLEGKLEQNRKGMLLVVEAKEKLEPSCNNQTAYGGFNASREEEMRSLESVKEYLEGLVDD